MNIHTKAWMPKPLTIFHKQAKSCNAFHPIVVPEPQSLLCNDSTAKTPETIARGYAEAKHLTPSAFRSNVHEESVF